MLDCQQALIRSFKNHKFSCGDKSITIEGEHFLTDDIFEVMCRKCENMKPTIKEVVDMENVKVAIAHSAGSLEGILNQIGYSNVLKILQNSDCTCFTIIYKGE